jgi:hypothetical protein
MNRSESIAKIALALSKFQQAVLPAVKDRENPFFKSTYATLESVWATVKEPLAANELAVIQSVSGEMLTTMLLHSSGEWISGETPLYLKSKSSQELGSAISYARRYSLSAMLGIVDAEDDDGEGAMGRSAKDQGAEKESKPKQEVQSKAPSGPKEPPKPGSLPAPFRGYESHDKARMKVTEPMLKRLFAISNKAGLDDAAVADLVRSFGHTGSRKDLDRATYEKVCEAILKLP